MAEVLLARSSSYGRRDGKYLQLWLHLFDLFCETIFCVKVVEYVDQAHSQAEGGAQNERLLHLHADI